MPTDISYLDDSSAYLGLSHAADRPDEAPAPLWASFPISNGPVGPGRLYYEGVCLDIPPTPTGALRSALLGEDWLDHNNRRLEAEAIANGEPLPPAVKVEGGVVLLIDRDLKEQQRAEYERLLKERQGVPYAELVKEAETIVAARQVPTHRNQGAYDDIRAERARIAQEFPNLPLADQYRAARDRVDARAAAAGGVDRMDGGPRGGPDPYLGDTIENIMRPSTEIEHSGSRKGKRRAARPHAAPEPGEPGYREPYYDLTQGAA